MSDNDELDLRQLIGENPEDEQTMPSIEDVPASQLPITGIINEKKIDARVSAQVKALENFPGLRDQTPKDTPAHPIPLIPMDVEYPLTPLAAPVRVTDEDLRPINEKKHNSQDIIAESDMDLDEEYRATFAGTVAEVKDLEPEELQKLRHRLYRMVRRAKIQQRAIRVTEEGKLSLIDEKRRKAIQVKDSEFMSKRKPAEVDAITGKPKVKKAAAEGGLSPVEKQIKQFVKLNMSDDVIAITLTSLGTAVPSNLSELTAKYRK